MSSLLHRRDDGCRRVVIGPFSVHVRYVCSATGPMLWAGSAAVNTQNTYFERQANNSPGRARPAACSVTALNRAQCRCLEAWPVIHDLVGNLLGSLERDRRCRCRYGAGDANTVAHDAHVQVGLWALRPWDLDRLEVAGQRPAGLGVDRQLSPGSWASESRSAPAFHPRVRLLWRRTGEVQSPTRRGHHRDTEARARHRSGSVFKSQRTLNDRIEPRREAPSA